MSRDFETDIDIEKSNLVEELIRQPQLFYDWAKMAASASVDTTAAKDKYDVMKAEIELRVRKHPALYDLPDKPTEAMVRATVVVNSKVKKMFKRYLEALRIEKLLSKAERAFEHRKSSLEGLVKTNAQFYFADPNTDSRTRQRVVEKTLIDRVREKRKLRRRRGYG